MEQLDKVKLLNETTNRDWRHELVETHKHLFQKAHPVKKGQFIVTRLKQIFQPYNKKVQLSLFWSIALVSPILIYRFLYDAVPMTPPIHR